MCERGKDHDKICLLIMRALFCGGAEKQYRYIISEMESEKRNLAVLLLNSPFKGEEAITQEFVSNHPHVRFYQLNGKVLNCNSNYKSIVTAAKIGSLIRQFYWLQKFLRKNSIDRVMFSYVTQLLMMPLFCRHRVKVIFNEQNTGRQICEKPYKRYLLKKCFKVIANSQYAANYVKEKTDIEVEVFHNAIEEATPERIPHQNINILIPARIMHLKNQKSAIEALDILRRRGKNNIKLLLAGDFEELNYVRKLENLVNKLQLKDCVEFMGQIDDMMPIYGIADLVVLPSFEEGTPNVLLEAFMYKIRYLASNIPMNADIVPSADFLFDPSDPKDLADKIQWILEMDPESWIRHGRERYDFVIENYGINSLHKRYENLLFH